METKLSCRLINIRENTKTSKNGIIFTVVAHLRNICHKINVWIDVNKYAIDKMHEVKPRPKEDNPLTEDISWSRFKGNIDKGCPWSDEYHNFFERLLLWNWFGPGWWGGSKDPNNPGKLPPLNPLDGVAMRHDFGYQIAELC